MVNKNKKGFLILPIIYSIFGIVFLGLLIWFGFKINEGLLSTLVFIKQYWWALVICLFIILFRAELRLIIKKVLKL